MQEICQIFEKERPVDNMPSSQKDSKGYIQVKTVFDGMGHLSVSGSAPELVFGCHSRAMT
jgi:hypothetical protein